ncbi:MAG: IPT/TIG domain-containing protein, partial [Armatimonadota bacterium]
MTALTICAVLVALTANAEAQVPTIDGTVGSASANPDSYVQVPVTISMAQQSIPLTDGTVILQVLDSSGQLSQTAKITKVEPGSALPAAGLNFGTNPPEVYPGDPSYDPNYPGTNSVLASFFYFDQKAVSSGTLLNVTVKTHGTQVGDQFALKLAGFQLSDSTVMPPLDYNCVPHDGALTIAGQIVVAPQTAVVRAGQGQQFTATVFGLSPATVQWEVVGDPANGTVGPRVTTSGQSAFYIAPAVVDVERNVTLRVTSLADPTKQAQATITLKPAIRVVVQPATATLRQGSTIQFTATVENVGPGQGGVTWSIDPALGSIDQNGLYTPPTAPIPDGQQQTVTVRATNVTEGITTVGTAVLTVKPAIRVQITGPAAVIQVGRIKRKQTVTFAAVAVNADNPAVTWSATAGTINPDTGQYTAPDTVPTPPTVTITAASVEDPSKSAQVTLQVTPGAVQVSPSSVSCKLGSQLQTPFTATVDGVRAPVNWSADYGTITQSGEYTAPAQMPASGKATVTATDPDTGLTGTAVVNLQDVTITLTPDAGINTIRGGRSFTITAAVAGTDDKRVSWTAVNTATGQPFGSITARTDNQPAVYSAPPAGSFTSSVTVRVTATTFDLGRTATLDFTVRPGIVVAVSGPAKTNVDKPGVQFAAVVSGVAAGEDAGVVWSIVSGGGTIDAGGLYTPTGVTAPADVVVRATSIQAISEVGAATAEFGSATIQVLPPVSTTISIQEGRSFVARGGQLHLNAVVSNFINSGAVTWSVAPVNPGDDPGTISQSGVYTAPAQVTHDYQVVVTATPADDPRPGHGASITITVKQVEVVVTPDQTSVRVGKSVGLRATASGVDNPVFTWEIVRGGGSLSATTGAQVVYTAPSTVPTPPEAEIRATVQGVSAPVVLEIRDRVIVNLTPTQASARVGGNDIPFSAGLANWRSGDPPIVWKVNGLVGGSSTVGTITQAGVYSPPSDLPTPNVVTVSAESPEDPAWKGTATVTLKPRPRVRGISPTKAAGRGTLEITGTDFGSAGIVQIGGSSAGIVTELWTDTRIRVTQPGNLSGGVRVIVDGSASNDDIQFRIVAGIDRIEVSPSSAVLKVGDQVRFTAVAKDAAGNIMTDVTIAWVASPDPSEPGAGTISQDGLFTAAGVGRLTITASPLGREGEHKVGTAAVAITEAPRVTGVSPSAAPVGAEVTVFGLNFGRSQAGSVLTIGGVPAQVKSWSSTEIRAVVADGTRSGPVVVTVAGTKSNDTVQFTVLASVSVSPASADVLEGTSAAFSAVGVDVDGNSVTGLTFQ